MMKERTKYIVGKIFLFLTFIPVVYSLLAIGGIVAMEVSNAAYRLIRANRWFGAPNVEAVAFYLFSCSIAIFLYAVIYFIFCRKNVSLPTKISLLISGAANPFLYSWLSEGKFAAWLDGGNKTLYVIGLWLLIAITAAEIIMLIREVVVNLKEIKADIKKE